ncbi:hypothetical protein [Pseudoalteromonas umbrosa]|uniref:hypothetical protein n=1 Tax=Pseudoalteromonas umbrosa TaxID=3048489 RepID=UPI0024C28DB0|nr:hypothetical protein [Pseudoalteromonas sp. B95]MDK1290186.1 hypothetical protein [Pseudoalteromonas sp. B95]
MTLDELIDYVMTESGEFIVGELETTQINRHRFHLIVKRALAIYSKYRPLVDRQTLTVNAALDLTDQSLGFTPEWVSRVVPVSDSSTSNMQSAAAFIYGNAGGLSDPYFATSRPRQIPWEYNKPILSVSGTAGLYDVTMHRHHTLSNIRKDDKNLVTHAEVDSIDYSDDIFFDILVGFFLMSLGRSRRAFTLNDLPVTMDASDLVSEGEDKVNDAKERLTEQSSWYLALGE